MEYADSPQKSNAVQYAGESQLAVKMHTSVLFDWHHVLIVSSTLQITPENN